MSDKLRGFLIQLLILTSIFSVMLSITIVNSSDHMREERLRDNLAKLRASINKFHADTGKYPPSLQELVDRYYLRSIPVDPVARSDKTWVLISPPDGGQNEVFDVRSGAKGKAHDGTDYASW